MNYLTPFVTIGASHISDKDLTDQAKKYNTYLHQENIPILDNFE